MLRKFVLAGALLVAAFPLVARAGICDRTWDGDRLALLGQGRGLGDKLRLNDPSGQQVATISVGQIKAFQEAKDGVARVVGTHPAFVICDNPEPNAFAFPGKNGDVIGVTVGMLRLANGDRDMAAEIIGHEYAHHTQHHLQNAQVRDTLIGLLGLAIGVAIDSKLEKKTGIAHLGLDLGQIGANLVSRKFDRDQELEADEVGFQYLVKAGFNPQGAVRLAQLMQQKGLGGSGLFYDTHPGWEERTARFKARIAANPEAQRLALAAPAAVATPEPSPAPAPAPIALLPTYQASDGQKAYVEALAAFQRKDTPEGVRHLRAAAEAGYAPAQGSLGYLYMRGAGGLPKDEAQAVRILQQGVAQGDALAQGNLGFMYQLGAGGLAQSDSEAARLYQLSAAQGNAIGQSNLGYFYQVGRGGLAKDEREAVRLYQLAAEAGNAQGRNNLGTAYRYGYGGLSKDEVAAARLYKLAASQGNALAQANYGNLLLNGLGGVTKDEAEAVRYLRLAVAQGNGLGQASLGHLYLTGKAGVDKSMAEAVRLFQLSAAQGTALGKNNLGAAYEFGWAGMPKDLPRAIALYREAAGQGLDLAKRNLERLGAN